MEEAQREELRRLHETEAAQEREKDAKSWQKEGKRRALHEHASRSRSRDRR